jgi:hypothetical protein
MIGIHFKPMDRSATDTIKGYFYQFDYSILNLLQLENDTDLVQIECIEDIDIHTATDITAVQCKYYAKTEYNHSVIKEPIMFMLSHSQIPKQERFLRLNIFLPATTKQVKQSCSSQSTSFF